MDFTIVVGRVLPGLIHVCYRLFSTLHRVFLVQRILVRILYPTFLFRLVKFFFMDLAIANRVPAFKLFCDWLCSYTISWPHSSTSVPYGQLSPHSSATCIWEGNTLVNVTGVVTVIMLVVWCDHVFLCTFLYCRSAVTLCLRLEGT